MSRPAVTPTSDPADIRRWIEAWKDSDVTEEGSSQTFLNELCDLLGAPRPAERGTAYVFERKVKAWDDDAERETTKSIDLYRRDHFILESKKYDSAKAETAATSLLPGFVGAKSARTRRDTAAHRKALNKAKKQAEAYVAALPEGEPPPPLLLVLDVGHSLEIYAEFTRRGKNYRPLPLRSLRDARHTVGMDDLALPAVREELLKVWSAPEELDRSKETARITRTVAGYLAKLAARYEQDGHPPELVAGFLTRCLFCMFAEDVGLLPKDSFKRQLVSLKKNPGGFVSALQRMFAEMEKGAEHSGYFDGPVLHFNGGVFSDTRALPLQVDKNGVSDTLELLIEASAQDWSLVEPAIFGTLLERALNPDERHKLGAHFTPRAYVERLVAPTLLNELREDWENTEIDALAAFDEGRDAEAFRTIDAFHKKLCAITVLDPACGSGNFLYVAYDLIKDLEAEVIARLREFGKSDKLRAAEKSEILRAAGYTFTVDPHQFLGLELNPRAVRLASLVLWIGHLRRHRRLHGDTPPSQPVLKDFQNIRHADAALTHADPVVRKDSATGRDTFVWSRAMKRDALGREIPDTTSVVPVYDYPDAKPADWLALLGLHRVDYIVGNPPFIGGSRLRELLGDGYAEALWAAYPDMGESSDFVMYWWRNAARLAAATDTSGIPLCRRFGFITTNSLKQIFNRRVIDLHLRGESLIANPAEQSRAEQSRAEQSRAEQSRAARRRRRRSRSALPFPITLGWTTRTAQPFASQ